MSRAAPQMRQQAAVMAALAAREDELVDFARELVATPSPNPPGDERAVADLVRQAMTAYGFDEIAVIGPSDERPSVIGAVGARGGRSLILNGHLDTKPPGDERAWAYPPYGAALVDGRIHGLGAADMKGAVAAMVFAGRALADAGPPSGLLRVALTADEEAGSRMGAGFVAARIEPADAVLVGEPTGIERPWEYVGVVARGISCFRIVVRGTQMHSSLTDRLPSVNASVKLGRALTRFAEELRPRFALEPGCPPCAPSVNVGVTLRGGVFYGVCPGEAEFGVDVRLVPGMRREDLEEDVEHLLSVLRAEDPELDAAVEWRDGLEWLEPQRIDAAHPLVTAAHGATAEVLGRELPAGVFPGGTDAGYWQAAGMPALPALGPGLLSHAHAPNESVGVDEIVAASRIYALTALRFLSGEDDR